MATTRGCQRADEDVMVVAVGRPHMIYAVRWSVIYEGGPSDVSAVVVADEASVIIIIEQNGKIKKYETKFKINT